MNVEIFRLTEEIIDRAIEEQDTILLQKEATFLLNSFAMVMPEVS
jgi:hypothetical protein